MSDRDLNLEIQEFLETHGPSTSTQVALGIRAQLATVIDRLASFPPASRPEGGNPRAKFYGPKSSQPFPEARPYVGRAGTHKQRVLALLADGKPHTHHELYALGVIAHSRIADLRKSGHTIACWTTTDRGDRVSIYQLIGSLDAAPASDNDDGGDPPSPGMTDTGAASSDTDQLSFGDAA